MKDLTQGPIGGHLAQMSLFIGASMLIQTLYYLVDLYFVARLGEQALAGVSAAGTIMFVVLALTQVLGVGTVTLISHAVGRKDQSDANLVFNQSLVLSTLCAAVVLGGGYGLADAYMQQISSDAGTAAAGKTYLHWFLPCLALQFAVVALGSALRGTGIVKPTMLVQALTVILNIILAPVLIAGWVTGRPLGVMGAALASSISIAVGTIVLLVYFARLEHYVTIRRSQWRPRLETWRRMLERRPARRRRVRADVRDRGSHLLVHSRLRRGRTGRIRHRLARHAMHLPATDGDRVRGFTHRRAELRRAARRPGAGNVSHGAARLPRDHGNPHAVVSVAPRSARQSVQRRCRGLEAATRYLQIVSWNFIAMGIVFTCSGLFQAMGNTWPALLSSGARILTFVVPAVWLSTRPWVRLEHFWYLSVASVALQAVFSWGLLQKEFRRRLAFAAQPVAQQVG